MRFTSLLCRVSDMTKQFSNLPESYIKRSMEQVYWRTPRGFPQHLPREVAKKRFRFTTNRPWTAQFRQQNQPQSIRKKVFLEPIKDWSFFRGDRVEVLVGRDKGKQGIVMQVIQERNWVIVEGLNCHLRTIGRDKDFPGVKVKSEAPLLVTDQVALVDPSDLQPTTVEWRFTESGEKVRVSNRSGRIIPIPKLAEETMDYKTRSSYKAAEKDTVEDDLSKITFEPKLKTFEMDIMEHMGIKEERTPAKTYWY
ncbi:large ribosomal subunit protein uL24m [Anabrus simplex]|uniref:large ribosomal subunit protein uL24m n=1 Tax=Anabrus simplex TaxID=316456 RepID=UPI0034DDA12D